MSDAEIVDLLRAKSFEGLEKLIDMYGTTIFWQIRKILNHSAEYEYVTEVENDVFLAIWEKIGQFDAELASFKTWLIQIARNKALDRKRRVIRELKRPLVLDEGFAEDRYFTEEVFLDLVAGLDDLDQLIFLKKFFYEDSGEEIAEDLGISRDVVYARVSRGKKKLRALYKEEGEHEKSI
ncbi:sigma-70 family RNA polymerase sigma factor [Listeria weihenstephanensis]|uniref:Sigma-70 family RNA polymerase sigma factor n=1 Tax=Listeria weihenstephanensis TaxID=1006155 RepID=A0A841Z1F8_9LIST|nr:sigma-70 family RNA polymerase sigma factor [Listeria weihenstephanensis]MBC1499090.1 sigma-70 family RNA polymerase sigma factor [Listeria weihenstephanensis]